MSIADEVVNLLFVMVEERVDVVMVDDLRALGLGKDEVGEEDETDPAVEWDPKEVSAALQSTIWG